MQKTFVRPLCSIFSNGSHIFQRIKNRNIEENIIRNNHTNFIQIHSEVSKIFSKRLRRRRTPSDGKKLAKKHLKSAITTTKDKGFPQKFHQ